MKDLVELLTVAAKELFGLTVEPELSRPEEQFGDYSTNLALQLSKQLEQKPQHVAEQLKTYLVSHKNNSVARVEVAGPGFLNIYLTDAALWQGVKTEMPLLRQGQSVLLEYSNPNAFKELHTGHLYQTIVGDTIGRLLETSGAKVFRANFGGDVGMHVGKAMYGIKHQLGGEHPEKLAAVPEADRSNWLSKAYV